MQDDIPVLLYYPSKYSDKVCWVWCPHCKTFHTHGIGPGHRQAHCGSDSPFKKTGYYLVPADEIFDRAEKGALSLITTRYYNALLKRDEENSLGHLTRI